MAPQPALDGRRLVGGRVVADHVDAQPTRDLGVDLLQDRLNSMARCHGGSWQMTLPEAPSRAASRVVVPWCVSSWVWRWSTRQDRQDGGDAVQGLHARLLGHAQHDRRLGWVQIQPDHVADLVDELGSVESLNASVRWGLSPNARQIR